jgi:DNA repair protein RadD
MFDLRPYQEKAVQSCEKLINDSESGSGLVVIPTAGGKSIVIAETIKRVGRKALVLQPTRELLIQNLNKYKALGGVASVYCDGLGEKEIGQVTFASLASVKNIGESMRSMGISELLIDEAHFSYDNKKSSMFSKFKKDLNPSHVIGLTATPFRIHRTLARTDLKLLTTLSPKVFDKLIHITQIQEMISNGWWSPFEYECYELDESGLVMNSSGTDYSNESLKQVNKAQNVNNNIYKRVRHLVEKEGVKSILVFVDDLENAEVFNNVLPYAAVLSSKTKDKERKEIVEKFLSGEIKVLFNYSVLDTGFDFPDLECLIMGRATKSFMTYYQILGRLVRLSNVKKRFIDYGNNVKRFGPIENFELKYFDKLGYRLISNGFVVSNCDIDLVRRTPEEMISGQRISSLDMPFGKNKGKALCELPLSYMEYMVNNMDFLDKKLKDEMNFLIKR